MQNNQLPTKAVVELKDNSSNLLFFVHDPHPTVKEWIVHQSCEFILIMWLTRHQTLDKL